MYYFNDKGQKVSAKENYAPVKTIRENFDSDPKGSDMSMIYIAIGVLLLIGVIAGLWYWNSKKEGYEASSDTFAGHNPNMKFSQMGFTYL